MSAMKPRTVPASLNVAILPLGEHGLAIVDHRAEVDAVVRDCIDARIVVGIMQATPAPPAHARR
jgi:hypothetical protein